MLLEATDFVQARALFVRAVGLVTAVALGSLLVQLPGLYGRRGILPIAEYLRMVGEGRTGIQRVAICPSLFWLASSDRALYGVAGLGLGASLVAAAGFAPAPALLLAWVAYLSFVTTGQDFTSFQWDVLLIDVLPLAALAALGCVPSPWVLLAVWLLSFRVVFASGVVKLQSGDPTWRDLTALTYHFETQPLPTRLAWYVHRLPRSVQRVATAAALGVELMVPLFIFGPDPFRVAAAILLAGFQVIILLTGNYGFFNLLALALVIPLVPDRLWPDPLTADVGTVPLASWSRPAVDLLGSLLVLLHLLRVVALFRAPAPLERLLRSLARFRLLSPYGLFAVMTTVRYEIVVEGSEDGRAWRSYEFRWKPGDPRRPPRWAQPHQPRLDWQMWFAALGSYAEHPWFVRFLQRLLEGSPAVLRLLEADPFPQGPPRYVRATRAIYRFTDPVTRRETDRSWEVRLIGPYCPTLTLRQGGPHLP